MVGIYLSGTGNTKHCIKKLLGLIDPGAVCMPIEDEKCLSALKSTDEIYLAFPTQFSNMPYIVRDFINKTCDIWNGKRVFILSTMGAFSGDSTGCAARLLKKYGATIIGGVLIKMPDSVCDNKLLKKPLEENQRIVKEADIKIEKIAADIKSGKYPKEGLSFFAHMAGLFGQRLWFYNKTTGYTDKLKIEPAKCVGCGLCSNNCPTKNIVIKGGKAVASGQCTMCYRCVDYCPKQAITLLGKTLYEQPTYEKNAK